MDEIVTLETFLKGCCGNYPVTDETLTYVCVKRGVNLDADVALFTDLERDVIEMEMLKYLLRAPMMTASVQDANGTWSHKEGAVEMNSTDKKFLELQLGTLEEKYGVKKSTINMHNYGIKEWH